MTKEITKKFSYSYDGRTEFVDRGNNLNGMRVKLNTYGSECCTATPYTGKTEPQLNGELELNISGDEFFEFFKNYGEFEITIRGVKPKKE